MAETLDMVPGAEIDGQNSATPELPPALPDAELSSSLNYGSPEMVSRRAYLLLIRIGGSASQLSIHRRAVSETDEA